MINDPELKAMSDVYNALDNLDESTQLRVVEWVLSKLQSTSASKSPRVKKGPKSGTKRRKRGRKPGSTNKPKVIGAKRGPKPGSKRSSKSGKRGRPIGSGKKALAQATSKTGKRRGRPRKNPIVNQ